MQRTDIERLNKAVANREPMALVTWLESGEQKLFGHPNTSDMASDIELSLTLSDAFNKDRSTIATIDGDEVFIKIYNPPLRMIVVGAVHIAQPLCIMAREAGYDLFLIDPREAFGAQHRFPDLPISNDWPDEALAELGIDARTAVVTLSHDPKIDDPALETALVSDAFYIGALGSTRTHAKRVDRLTKAGVSQDHIARLHAPVGLDIGASTPAEIALSVLGEVTERLRRPQTRPAS